MHPDMVKFLPSYAETLKGFSPRAIKFIAEEMVVNARRQESKLLTTEIAPASLIKQNAAYNKQKYGKKSSVMNGQEHCMLSMRKKNLFQCSILIFFCIICFVTSISCEMVQVQSPCENTPYMQETENNEFKFLVENIYDLLQQNHSTDEIIEILSDDQDGPYDIQKLVIHINELLHGQNSKGSIINIIVDNKDSKEYYAHKNFLTNEPLAKVCK